MGYSGVWVRWRAPFDDKEELWWWPVNYENKMMDPQLVYNACAEDCPDSFDPNDDKNVLPTPNNQQLYESAFHKLEGSEYSKEWFMSLSREDKVVFRRVIGTVSLLQ
jgi:hypothetical protein